MLSNEMIYIAGLILVGVTVLLAAIAVPIFVFTRANLKKQLENDYGPQTRSKKIEEKKEQS